MAEPADAEPGTLSRWSRTGHIRRLAVVPRARPTEPAEAVQPVPDAVASELLADLRTVDLGLARLLQRVLDNETPFVVVSPVAIAGWRAKVPGAWIRVEGWLRDHQITIIEV
jgi:hypothetical protein